MSVLVEPVTPNDHILGPRHARVVLVEYLDYECPFCARAYREVNVTLRRVGRLFQYVVRHFPLSQTHEHARLAAQAAEAAGAQEAFWPMHSMLFENREALDYADLLAYASTLGLDLRRFKRDMRSGVLLAKIHDDFRSGLRSGVSGTPSFFLDGYRYGERWDADTLTHAIEDRDREAAGVGAR